MKVRLLIGAVGLLAGFLIIFLLSNIVVQARSPVRPSMPVLQAEIRTSLNTSARQPLSRPITETISPLFPQVVVGMPKAFVQPSPSSRYTYRNEFPEDRSKKLPLYLIDTHTGQETRLGDDSGAAEFAVQNESYLLWHFWCDSDCGDRQSGLYAYNLVTQENRLVSSTANPSIHPKIAGVWVAFGSANPGDSPNYTATLLASNLQTGEIVTLTHELRGWKTPLDKYFGISSHLAAWYAIFDREPDRMVVYDLAEHMVVAELDRFNTGIYNISPGESVVIWNSRYGYDLLTHSYFQLPPLFPPDWQYQPITSSSLTERNRILNYKLQMQNGASYLIKAPLLDASLPGAHCVAGQDLVQNGDLENVAGQVYWSQRSFRKNPTVYDPAPFVRQVGNWLIRLGRESGGEHEARQLLTVPSRVTALTLSFDVHASSRDRTGSAQLEMDLVDAATDLSLLTTTVRWRSSELASADWLPITVQIKEWPESNAPLYLVFRAVTNKDSLSNFSLDNIHLVTDCIVP